MSAADLSKKLRREFSIAPEAVQADARTVDLCFASESPVERYFGTEVLNCEARYVRLDRLNTRAPLLLNHDTDKQIGVVEKAWIDADKKARATVRFSKSALGEEIFQDVKDGIRSLVSVGYQLHKLETEKQSGGAELQRATDWEPLEISIVAVPADTSAGVGRSLPENQTKAEPVVSTHTITMSAPVIEVKADDVRAHERKRIADITTIAKRHKLDALAEQAVNDGITADEFGSRVLGELAKRDGSGVRAVTAQADARACEIGMSDKEADSFSLLRAVRSIANGRNLEGLEKEACEAMAKLVKRELKPGAIVIPQDVFRRSVFNRAQNVTTATAGGYTVASNVGPLIELLRNRTVVAAAGATQLTGLVGNVQLPKHTGGATAYWVSETGALTDSQSTFGQVTLTPHRLGATVPYSTQFLAQSSLDAEAFIRDDLMKVLSIEKDRAALHGSGGSQPIGIASTSGINATVTYGGAATWADVVEAETGIAVDNADIGDMAFVLSAATVGKWKTILKDSVAGADYLINSVNGTANGYTVHRTNQVAGNVSFFGVWSQLVMASWAGLEVIVDPYALKKSGQVEITVNELCDLAVRQPLAFNVSTDSAAQ